MENEIKFFHEEEVKETPVMGRPPNYETNPACGTPNPPPWCGDPNSTNIDMYLLILVVIAILIKLNFKNKKWST